MDIGGRTLCHGCQLFPIRRILRFKIFAARRSLPRPIDEVAETIAVALQPPSRFLRIFRRWTVLPRHKFFGNAHELTRFFFPRRTRSCDALIKRWDGDAPPSTGPLRDDRVAAQCP